jgi:AraC-like DNA-binding protein
LVDRSRRYQLQLDPEFPFTVQLLSYDDVSGATSLHWHERLEIFVPTTGTGEFRMGTDLIPFSAGDLLVVDNLRVHGLTRFTGEKRTAVVITFLADLVYRFGSPSCDFLYLTPFYCQSTGTSPLIPATHRLAPTLHTALEKLLQCYFMSADGLQFQVGCKTHLLELLYTLTQHFGWPDVTRSVYLRQKTQARRLGDVYDYVKANYSSRIPVSTVAAMASMSESRFMRYFKEVTGMTFVQYVTHVRLLNGCHLLRESDLSVAAIADRVGFSDQSYFDKRFREHFSRTPSEFRSVRWEAGRAEPTSVRSPV